MENIFIFFSHDNFFKDSRVIVTVAELRNQSFSHSLTDLIIAYL